MTYRAWSHTNPGSHFRDKGGRSLISLIIAAALEVFLAVPQILIVAFLGVEAGRGLVWPVWFWVFVLSLVVAVLAIVGLVLTFVELSAYQIAGRGAAVRTAAAAFLVLIAPANIFMVPLLEWIGLGPH